MKNSKLIEGVHYAELDKLSFDELADKYAPAQEILMKQKTLIKNNPDLSKDALNAYQHYCDLLEEAMFEKLNCISNDVWRALLDRRMEISVMI